MAYTRGSKIQHGTREVRAQGHSNGDELREALRRRCTPGRSRPGYSGLGLGLVVVVAAVVVAVVAALAAKMTHEWTLEPELDPTHFTENILRKYDSTPIAY